MIEKATHVTIFWNLARNPEKIHQKFALKNAKFEVFASELVNIHSFTREKVLAIFDAKIEIGERCKGVHCVDLGESFPTSICLQKSASIQPRTSPSKFRGKLFNIILFIRVLRLEARRFRGAAPRAGAGSPRQGRTPTRTGRFSRRGVSRAKGW